MYELNASNTRQRPILLAPGGAKLYAKLGPVDILELRRKVLENLPSDYIGFNKYWANE
jgi:hypothetical protein